MKRALLIFFDSFIVMQFIQTEKVNIAVNKDLEIKTEEKVMNIFTTACYDCHSNEAKWPWYSCGTFFLGYFKSCKRRKKSLNFSIWEEYSEKKKKSI